MRHSPYKLIPDSFSAVPTHAASKPAVEVIDSPSTDVEVVGIGVGSDGSVPAGLGVDRDFLERAGFAGAIGQTLALHGASAPLLVAVGTGPVAEASPASLRDAAAAFARASARSAAVAFDPGDTSGLAGEAVGRTVTEGVLLARYRFHALKTSSAEVALQRLEIVVPADVAADAKAGAQTGRLLSVAEELTRDLANTPPAHLTAAEFGEVAREIGPEFGLDVQTYGKDELIEMGCGGLLGVNAGSFEEPRMIVVRYKPDGATKHLAMIGKGIMYDSGGISLKPSDPMHFSMKMDMAGAAAVFGAMTALRDLGCTSAVSAWLMCTDNMPGGSATRLGDVLTARNGMTVEVRNTDAEGRLVMMDGLALAAEEKPDGIVDIATLTGAALRALGPARAVVLGNDQGMIDRVIASAERTDEKVWQFPLERRYRSWLDSDIADISNLGGTDAGSTTAALFLDEFVDGIPWAHIDIAGTMQTDRDDSWRSKGATGYGARLLADLAVSFSS